MKSHASEKMRHVVVRGEAGDVIPDSIAKALDEQAVACGWLRASAVLRDVEVRAYDSARGAPGATRRIAGPVQAIVMEGSVGFARGEVSVGLRAVLARETDRGMETIAGEIVGARVVALEGVVTAFDDLALPRGLDASSNVVMLGEGPANASASSPSAPEPPRYVPPPAPSAPGATTATAPSGGGAQWSEAIAASADVEAPRPRATIATMGSGSAVLPPRIVRPVTQEDPTLIPEAGDAVEHFAFGPADVIKSDGERLHLRVHKDQRIREIALEMLRVTPLPWDGPGRKFKLDRKL